ncbi:MAG: ATP-dependent helicase [Bacteroidetes bacterium]|nr:ATP-dependent helicase [Bacteroidota bacterium]
MILFFQGEAGTGKTTELITATNKFVKENELLPYQKVLALTFMHGSRKRLTQRLSSERVLSKKFECTTIDSFATHLLFRWRTFFLINGSDITINDLSYDDICAKAVELLQVEEIRNWVKRKYPLILIDEMQDCKNHRLKLIQNLSITIDLYVAADSFQDLDTDDDSNEATNWLSVNSEIIQLNTIHRTNISNIIELSKSIRNSGIINPEATNAYVCRCYNHTNAAHSIARNIEYSFRSCKNHVILSPTKPENSNFVRDTLDLITTNKLNVILRRNPKEIKKEIGPFHFDIEKSEEELCNSTKQLLAISINKNQYTLKELLDKQPSKGVINLIHSWIKRKNNILGQTLFSYEELNKIIGLMVHTYRSHYKKDNSKFNFMTIHQAKNREFDHVILLWPYQVQGTDVKKRKLLYNAVTRAKKKVDVIVLDPKNRVLNTAPFS